MLPPISVLVALCLYCTHILSGDVLSSLVWLDLFTLQAHSELSNTYQNSYSPHTNVPSWGTNLYHILHPSKSVLSPSLTIFIILTYTHLLEPNTPSTLSISSHLRFLLALSFSIFEHFFDNAS